MNLPIRIQINYENTLVAEAIVDSYETANALWSAFTNAKYFAGKEFGGAVMSRADLPRTFQVRVGETIQRDDCFWNKDNV